MSWAQLLKRVFPIQRASCPQCSGPLTLIAAIEAPRAAIPKILARLGCPTCVPPQSQARLDDLLQAARGRERCPLPVQLLSRYSPLACTTLLHDKGSPTSLAASRGKTHLAICPPLGENGSSNGQFPRSFWLN